MPAPRSFRTRALLLLLIAPNLSGIDLVSFESVHDFNQPAGDGEYLNEPVTEGIDGLLYGATRGGGPQNGGLVFRMEKGGASYRMLHAFGTNGWSGRYPMNGVIQAKDGRLYGRALSGGEANGATIFGLNTDGSGVQLLHRHGQRSGGPRPRRRRHRVVRRRTFRNDRGWWRRRLRRALPLPRPGRPALISRGHRHPACSRMTRVSPRRLTDKHAWSSTARE